MIAVAVAGSAAAVLLLRASGPLLLGGRALPARWNALIQALPVALFAALVVTQTVVSGDRLVLDARVAGLAAAALALWRKAPLAVVLLAAVAATAAVRAL